MARTKNTRKKNIMKSFNEWLRNKNLEENVADWTPGFIRKPLQNMGLMGRTTDEEEAAEERRYRRSPEYLRMKKAEQEDEIRQSKERARKDYEASLATHREDLRKKKEEEALERKKKEARGLIQDPKTGEWRLPVVGKREREDWPYGG